MPTPEPSPAANALPPEPAWLRKNHRGGKWHGDGRRRHFRADGFHVSYYKDDSEHAAPTGCLDMRNVSDLRLTTDAHAPKGAVELWLSEHGSRAAGWFGAGDQLKMVIVAIPAEGLQRDAWLRYFASTAAYDAVSSELKPCRDAALASHLDKQHGGQNVRASSMFASRTPLSPRAADGEDGSSLPASRHTTPTEASWRNYVCHGTSGSAPPESTSLCIEVRGATGVPRMDWLYSSTGLGNEVHSDTYAEVHFVQGDGKVSAKKRTRVLTGRSPVWDTTLRFADEAASHSVA
jgi:hypothetical protein